MRESERESEREREREREGGRERERKIGRSRREGVCKHAFMCEREKSFNRELRTMCIYYVKSWNLKRCAYRQADGRMDGWGKGLKEVCGVEGDVSRAGEGLLNT